MRFVLLVITILASVGFFNPMGALSDQAQRLVFFVFASICLYVAIFRNPNDAEPSESNQREYAVIPMKPYVVLIIGIAVSIIMGAAFHAQSLLVSAIATLPYLLAYGMLFVLCRFNLPPEKIMGAYMAMCFVAAVVYFANVATFPANIFGKPILDEDITRGVIRIPVVFVEFFPVVVFYAINRFLISRKKWWLMVAALAFVMIVLSVIRQIIALTAILGLLFLMRNVNRKMKVGMVAAVIAVVVVVLPMIPMYRTMLELSEAQADENEQEENIRITAWRYYTYENQSNCLTAILGNGMPSFGNSRWGVQFESEVAENGCFAADVGWAGFYWYFGIIAVAALMWLMFKGIVREKTPDMRFATYSLVFLFITSFASGPPVYYWQIIDIAVCLYFAFWGGVRTAEPLEQVTPEPRSLLPRYPQFVCKGK